MQTIGVLGGMSWESTALYYRLMNEHCRATLGGHHSARILLHSFDFDVIERCQGAGQWDEMATMLGDAAAGLAGAGADFLVIATNTMHRLAVEISERSGLEVLHIADPTAAALKQAGLRRVGLLGTRYTMEQKFYRGRLEEMHGLDVIVPGETDRSDVHRIIYDELCLGVVTPVSRVLYQSVIGRLKEEGAEAVILGCTEITMLIAPDDSILPVYDTTALHAAAAVDRAIGQT